MKKSDFEKLLAGLQEAGEFLRGGKLKGRVHIPDAINVTKIRAKTGLSLEDFASKIGISLETLRNWEDGRRVPDGPAQVLLARINKDPEIVRRTLKSTV
jgi:putative transcriptional regulator